MGLTELVDGSKSKMQLFRSLRAHELHAWILQEALDVGLCGVGKNISEAFKGLLHIHFHILNYAV